MGLPHPNPDTHTYYCAHGCTFGSELFSPIAATVLLGSCWARGLVGCASVLATETLAATHTTRIGRNVETIILLQLEKRSADIVYLAEIYSEKTWRCGHSWPRTLTRS